MINHSHFIPGHKLNELFYQEAVKPILVDCFPNLKYSAGLLGSGSEVLGFDTPQSMDHHWGPRMQLFVSNEVFEKYSERINSVLSEKLPHKFHGFPTNFAEPDHMGVLLLKETKSGPINHRVEVFTLDSFFKAYLGLDMVKEITVLDWLTLPEQKLLSVTAGKVFFDGLNELEPIRKKFNYYPHDVWLYLLSCQWTKISQEEAFVGRCSDVGDETGSKLVAARIVSLIMKLCFLMEKKYAPYAKWFGTAFSKLNVSEELAPLLESVLSAKDYKDREASLAKAYELVAKAHHLLAITPPLHKQVSAYYDRPYLVIHADIFAQEIKKQIKDKVLIEIAKSNIGAIDQFIDSTDVLEQPTYFERLKMMYSNNLRLLDE
jgi:hypothetical protein